MQLIYLAALTVSLIGMIVLDWKYRLAFFSDRRATVVTLLLGVTLFILWDALGIVLGIFFSGNSPYMSGIYLAPEFPIEELFFLTFLCYFTLIVYRLGIRRWSRIW
ncbi:lycopene cyclase domain-containing protein [Candidatus Saccharibacteria bacterium]|nr:lycopene cyclase domain-containing protein [Candidatus Saccharibacteria bacterium]